MAGLICCVCFYVHQYCVKFSRRWQLRRSVDWFYYDLKSFSSTVLADESLIRNEVLHLWFSKRYLMELIFTIHLLCSCLLINICQSLLLDCLPFLARQIPKVLDHVLKLRNKSQKIIFLHIWEYIKYCMDFTRSL